MEPREEQKVISRTGFSIYKNFSFKNFDFVKLLRS